MPYASSIQTANDANGTAYAFLEDNGAIWQCQWNAEAQRWDKGQVVPEAFGGEKLQALVLENLWPTIDSGGNNPGTAPGIVLAYRVGEGSSSQVLASFGRWGSDGQLQWSAPAVLSAPGVEVQAFALVPGEGSQPDQQGQTTFSLVLQAQQPQPPAISTLEQLAQTPQDQLQTALEELATASRPDTDLYRSSYRLALPQGASPSSPPSLQTYGIDSSGQASWSTATSLAPAVQESSPAGSPPLLGGNTQLSRQQLTSTTVAIPSLDAPAAAGGSQASGVTWGRKTGFQAGNNIRFGLLLGQNIKIRWEIGFRPRDKNNPDGLEAQAPLDPINRVTLYWRGSLGKGDIGGSTLSSFSTARLEVDANDRSSKRKPSSLEDGFFLVYRRLGLGFSGFVGSRYQYLDRSINKNKPLVSVNSSESIGIDAFGKFLWKNAKNGTIRFTTYNSVGVSWRQAIDAPSGGSLPKWLDQVGKVPGYLAELRLAGNILSFGVNQLAAKLTGLTAQTSQKQELEEQSTSLWAAIPGTVMALLGPVIALTLDEKPNGGLDGASLSSVRGFDLFDRFSAGWLYKGVFGFQSTLANNFSRTFAGKDSDTWRDQFFFSFGLALPLGANVNLFSYSNSWSNSPGNTTSEGLGLVDAIAGGGSSQKSAFISAPDGAAYPLSYAPQSADNSYFAPDSSAGATNPYLLGASTEPLLQLSLVAYTGAVNSGSGGDAPLTLVNSGQDLVDGTYSDVPILGLALTGGIGAFAKASFTVDGGSIEAASLQITAGGSCIGLPETQPGSGIYALVLDVFSSGIAIPPSTDVVGNPFANFPLLTVDSTMQNSPLSASAIQRISGVSSVPAESSSQSAAASTAVIYPEYNPVTGQTSAPPSNDNGPYTYQSVAVTLQDDSGATITLLNPDQPTATVVLSGGTIQRVDLNQPLLFSSGTSGGASGEAYSVTLALPAAVVTSLQQSQAPQEAWSPSYAFSSQSQAYNNVVAEEEFSAQSGAPDSGVYLASGVSDQLPLLPQMAGWPVQNRVTYSTLSSDEGVTTTWVLNRLKQTPASPSQSGSTENAVPIAPPSLQEVLQDQETVFTAASHPTAVTIAGPQGATYSEATFVAWVEASEPVIPITSADGSSNYQQFMQALYGNQRINFRILQTDGSWKNPSLADLYSPDGAVISQLRAFQIAGLQPSSWYPDGVGTLLVWDELRIDAIQDVTAAEGAGASIPSVLKAGWINPNATSFQWNDLFSFTDASGQAVSSIQTIPWDASTAVGLTISDISAGSLPVLGADGSAGTTALINFSQTVRTPYRQSVLNDQPTLYLELGALQSGINTINIGTVQDPSTTSTFASDTGLNFTIPGALPKSTAAAVQNVDGTGVLSTGLGTLNAPTLLITRNIPTQVAVFSGSINGTTLSVTSLTAGRPQVGDGLSGAGVKAGTTITAILSADSTTGLGTYTVSQSQSVAPETLQALPAAGLLSFSGSIDGTTLTVSALPQGELNVGDVVAGQGVAPGTRITAVLSAFDAATGQGTYAVDRSQTVAGSALLATPPPPSDPYTLEFWAQLQPGSNPDGAGLVALGQPSAGAVGPAVLPEGWLLGASFVVDRITYQQAAGQGLITEIPSGQNAKDTYAWGWAVVATGADTTALGGNGGRNLYSNALQISNLVSGVTLQGVDSFLANYNVEASELIGIDGSTAATMVSLPFMELQVDNFLDSSINNLPTSSLNGIDVDTSSAVLNGGLVLAADVSDNASLDTLFNSLWSYQELTGEAKVSFDLAPGSSDSTTTPVASSSERYSGYKLKFTLLDGPAVSVNGEGQLVFDVAPGVSITGTTDLRDGAWHYVAATYLPQYGNETVLGPNGAPTQPPTLNGTATLVVDNQVVGTSSVRAAYAANNLSDQALLLTNNAGGAIDQLALYGKALTTSSPPVGVSGVWPQPTANEALALWGAAGVVVPGQTPDQGSIPGALTSHWAARDVNPNGAELATYSTVFDPRSGSWSQATTLNPLLAAQPTNPSASAGSLQNDLVIAVPTSNWTSTNSWEETSSGESTSDGFFNPANKQLTGVAVTLTNKTETSQTPVTIQLTADQVLIGDQPLQLLQPLAQGTSLNYTVLSDAPAFNLVIPRDQITPRDLYNATYTFTFSDGTSVSNATAVPVNAFASSVATSGLGNSAVQATVESRNKALATAAVLEQAPLQLEYIDSGEVFQSRPTAASTSNTALSNTPETFGTSQAIGSFLDTSGNTNGWLAIAQPSSLNAASNPAGRIWIQYTGQWTDGTPSSDPAQAPTTWLNALANSNFSPDAPNLPLLGDAFYPSSTGGLLIQADPTAGWSQQLGQTMLVADVDADGFEDLVIAAPAANGGGKIYIINGKWISGNLTTETGEVILNLANPEAFGNNVLVLEAQPQALNSDGSGYDTSVAGFGTALAFDSTTTTLWIGAPRVLQKLNPGSSDSLSSLVPCGAIYSVDLSGGAFQEDLISLSPTYYGTSGMAIVPGAAGGSDTTYWGSELGTALAVDGSGNLAVSAPGVFASLAYSGTEAVQKQATEGKTITTPYGDGALVQIQLPDASGTVSSLNGGANPDLQPVARQSIKTNSVLATEESAYMQTLKTLQSVQIADATLFNNQAYQAAAVGAVYVLPAASLASSSTSASPLSGVSLPGSGYTLYGANPWNVLGPSGFGSSLAFADLTNNNGSPMLAIGADQAGGSGAVYLVDTSQSFSDPSASGWVQDINLGSQQYLAHLASALTLYGAASADNFGNGLVNLGDVNGDSYKDLLIQAFNASGGAGNGYVLFGTDQFSSTPTIETRSGSQATINNPAAGNVATSTIGQMKRADGSSFTAPILSELGYGPSAFTGLGSFGPGDVNGDGLPDVLLGAGGDASAYVTYGQYYLESISDLQLQKLTSSTGYRLQGLATTTQGSLRSIGDFNDDGYGDFISIEPGDLYTTVRLELGANTQEILADYLYEYYSFTVANGTEVLGAGDVNGDGYADIALFLEQNLSSGVDGNAGAGSTTGILYGRSSDQLPIGSGFGLQAPVDTSSQPLAALPASAIPGALSTQAPAMLAVDGTIYAVWCDETGNGELWFAQSSDGGNSWSDDTNLSNAVPGLASLQTPSLALFNGSLFLAFLNSNDEVALSSWNPASGNSANWSSPTVLSDGSSPFLSGRTPQLLATGDGLTVTWANVEDEESLYSSVSTSPQSSPWTSVDPTENGGASSFNPALAIDASGTIYMASLGLDHQLYWTSSTDEGQNWSSWQALPEDMTSQDAPSLAVLNGSLYLTYLGSGSQELTITQLTDAASNSWAAQTVISDQTAKLGLGAVAIGETENDVEGLAIYYVANDASGLILRTWSPTPLTSSSWSDSQTLGATSTFSGFTTSSPLAVTSFNGDTYLAYMGDASTSNTTAYIATAYSNPNSTSDWETVVTLDTGNTKGIGLSSDSEQLLLNTSDIANDQQETYSISPGGSAGDQRIQSSRYSISNTANTATLLAIPAADNNANLLLAVSDPSNGNSVAISSQSGWLQQRQLLERIESTDGTVSFSPIKTQGRFSATLLNGAPVLAVKSETVDVYASTGNTTFTLASSFNYDTNASGQGGEGAITTTDTGLALAYTSDGSVTLQRLDFLQSDGTPVDGVSFNADGSLDTSSTDLLWQGITLTATEGISTDLATIPLSVNGTLLLGSTSNASGSANQLQLTAIPVLSNPDSTTWLNSTVQLPNGTGGWTLQQQSGGSSGLTTAQTGSSLSPVGDLNNDGYADLIVTASNVLLNPGSDPSDAAQGTGLRVISGAATSAQLLSNNNATADSQTVQVAPGFGSNSSTPVASLSASVNDAPTLVLRATDQSSGQGSELQSQPSNTASSWVASAGELASAQQLFNPATPPVAGPLGLGLGFGDPALNTTGSFGDLNADGYLDALVGDTTFAFGVNGIGWHVWSIRAAGDVNGNGTDDVFLSLSPAEVPQSSSGQPQDLQTVLVDGALFAVDTTSNSFSLSDLRVGLDPGVDAWALQYWIKPVQSFAGSIGSPPPANSALFESTYQLDLTTDSSSQPFWATASDDQGIGYLLLVDGSNNLTIQGVDSASNYYVRNYVSELNESIFCSAAAGQGGLSTGSSSAEVHRGNLYLATLAGTSVYLSWIDLESLQNGDNTGWKSYQVPSLSTGSSPAVVSEGDALALYYPDAQNGSVVTRVSSVSPESADYWSDGTSIPIPNGFLSTSEGTSVGPVAATRFQGKTLLMRNPDLEQGGAVTLWQQPDQVGASWTPVSGYGTSGSSFNIWLNSNATQVHSGVWTVDNSAGVEAGIWSVWGEEGDTGLSQITAQTLPPTLYVGLMAGSGLSFVIGSSFSESQTYQFDSNQSGKPNAWPSVTALSRAGYSIDANIDTNGDGFMDMLVSDPSNPAAGLANQYVLFGGDYNQLASQVGTPANDVLIGTPLADVIYSIQGSDQVASRGGADVIYSGAGDDQISITDNAFIRIDAGSGFDALLLEGEANQPYDFRLAVATPQYFAGTKLRDIELISSIDYGANLLSFDAAAINAINSDRVLFLTPDASDSISLTSEFARNANFDTSYGGTLWSAYAAAPQSATPASANPALLYVRTPTGQTSDWLSSQVSTTATAPAPNLQFAAIPPVYSQSPSGQSGEPLASLPTTSPIADSQAFGNGLTLLAYREASGSDTVRFAIERSDTRKRQTVLYASSSQNSSAEPGRHYPPVAGLLAFEIGELRKDITIPIDAAAFAALRLGSVSLSVEELPDLGQQERHLLFRPAAAPDGAVPVLSGFDFSVDPSFKVAQLSFRADVNNGSGSPNTLRFQVGQRSSADAAAPLVDSLSTLAVLDAVVSDSSVPPAYDSDPAAYALDTDQRHNAQVRSQMTLDLMAQGTGPALFLSGPALRWSSPASINGGGSLSFDQTVNLSAWREDQGTGAVSFALVSGDRSVSLLQNASGGSAGAITPDTALDPGSSGWRSTEGKAVGSQAALSNLNLTGSTWTPTASRDGQQLALQDLQVDGNWINARFEGGVSLQLFLDAITSAPTPTPVRPQVDIQRLAGQDNGIGFYAVDAITGAVDGLNPGDSGYLEAALRRSEAADLLLDASELPAYGQERTYRELALDPNQQYGVLLLVDGSRERLFSSFAAANPGGAPQMLSLGSDSNGMVLGIEDLSVIGGRSDGDYNDLIVRLESVIVAVL